ncbi:hypothetical protein [Listeria booriae]|uniref:Uncharacterized protein n=1 Tax=Listeria booriae TaxID=1552123 RepID=A0A841YQQ2_9LIST|nr:hypothetical protein [Listeria booriae]MBC1403102.1 hypothetical protein [Listeria booriae]
MRCVQKSGNKTKSLYAIIDFESEIYPDQAARALDRWHEKKGDYQVLLQNEQNGSITAKHLNAFLRLEVHTRYASVDRIFRFILSEDERLELSNLVNGRY